MPEGIPTDQAPTEFDERAVNVRTTLETNTETTEVMRPGMRALNAPVAATLFGTALGDRRRPHGVSTIGDHAIHESVEPHRGGRQQGKTADESPFPGPA